MLLHRLRDGQMLALSTMMQPALGQLCACLRVIRQSDFSFKWNDKQLSHSWWLTLIPLICVSLRDRLGRRLSMMKAQQETSSMTMRTSTRVPALAVSVFVFGCVCTPWFFKTWQLLGFNLLILKTYPAPPFPGVMVALLTKLMCAKATHTKSHITNPPFGLRRQVSIEIY